MYFLLFLSAVFLLLSNLGAKLNKSDGSGKLLNIVIVVGVAGILSWIVCIVTRQAVTKDMILYAIVFAILFISCMLATYKAYEKGSMSGTALFSNAGLVVVILFSVLAYKEPFGITRILGVAGVVTALTLLTLPNSEVKKEKKRPFHFTWLVLCIVVLLSNSGISICGKIRQVQVGGTNPFAYMALCYTVTFILGLSAYALIQFKEKTIKSDVNNIKECIPSLAMQAFGNAGANLLVTFLSSRIDASILYPVSMGGSLVLTCLFGFLLFNEKKTRRNVLGIIIGICSIIILSI